MGWKKQTKNGRFASKASRDEIIDGDDAQAITEAEEAEAAAAESDPDRPPDEVDEPVKRKRGRPRKTQPDDPEAVRRAAAEARAKHEPPPTPAAPEAPAAKVATEQRRVRTFSRIAKGSRRVAAVVFKHPDLDKDEDLTKEITEISSELGEEIEFAESGIFVWIGRVFLAAFVLLGIWLAISRYFAKKKEQKQQVNDRPSIELVRHREALPPGGAG